MAIHFHNPVKGVAVEVPSCVWPEDYNPQGYYPIKAGYYESVSIPTAEQQRQFLLNSWTTEKQREFNASHDVCTRCRGRGATRRDSNVGCNVCLGTGSIPVSKENVT